MAATHLDFGVIQRTRPGRADGGSAVAASAYNACARHTQGDRVFDFTRKRGEHVSQAVLLPPGSPPAFAAPEYLWRAAEESERRVDAQTARQVLISVPREVPEDLRLPLLRAIAEQWVNDGMACQVDLHNVPAADGGEQPHAHFLLSLRRLTDAGFAQTKERRWNIEFRAGEGRAMRAEIEQRGNAFLVSHGLPALLDYSRRLVDDLPPEPTAPRQDWQAWKRTGADPERAPASVGAVITHREKRAALERAIVTAEAAFQEAADLEQQLSSVRPAQPAGGPLQIDADASAPTATSQKAPTRRSEGRPVAEHPRISPVAIPATESLSACPRAPQHEEHTEMAKKPARSAVPVRKDQHEPWMQREGGVDALSDAHRASAERSYEDWAKRKPKLAEAHGLNDYVRYVQGEHAKRRQQDAEAAQQAAAAAIRPDEPSARTAARVSRHAASALADTAPAVPGPGWSVQRDQHGATHYRTPEGGNVADHGDRLEPQDGVDPDRLIELARVKGWPSLALSGSEDFRLSMARAAALAEPPVQTDHPLPAAAQQEVSAAISARAASRIGPLDPAALRATATTDPASTARRILDQREGVARAALAGRPTGETDAAELARPKLADLLDRREHAREQATEAREAAAGHRAEHGWTSRLLDPATRRRQAALDDEAQRLDRHSRGLERGYERSERQIEREAARMAKSHKQALDDWKWSPTTRTAEKQLATLDSLRDAVDGGSPEITEAVARGDLRGAAKAFPGWQAEAPERERQEEERRREAEGQEQQEVEQQRRAGETPQETALRLATGGERDAAGDPEALQRARGVTAAVVARDQNTVGAITDHGASAPQTHAAASAFSTAKGQAAKLSAGLTKISTMVMGEVSKISQMGM